ncbi:MAG: UrcA family protein [Rhizomicrobium sp.]
MKTRHHEHLVLVAILLAAIAGTQAPAQAQARWKPSVESITVKAGAMKNWRMALTASHLGKAFAVSASIPVPYDDLDLVKEPDVTELTRRIQLAARLVCQELDSKYPPMQFPILEGYSGPDCVRVTARESMEQADIVIASAKH